MAQYNEEMPISAGVMSKEERDIGEDISNHAVQRIKTILQDAMDLHTNPGQTYLLSVNVTRLLMHSMVMFDIGTEGKPAPDRSPKERVVTNAIMTLMLVLADLGSKECKHMLRRTHKAQAKIDYRAICTFLAHANLK